jgi:signal transduction histidine kinase
VALVGPSGRIVAVSDHAWPVSDITRVGNFIAVQGDGRNLSMYDSDLTPLWDHDSPVADATLVAGDFVGDASEGLAVVGTRTYQVGVELAGSIREALHIPDFMAGAERDGDYLHLRRSFVTFYLSNEGSLQRMVAEGRGAAADAFAAGRIENAVDEATDARAAAAVLDDKASLRELSSRIHQYGSYNARRRSILISALILGLLGTWIAVGVAGGKSGTAVPAVGTALLLAGGAWAWKLAGDAGVNPVLFVGGIIAGASLARTRIGRRRAAQVPGAAIEDLVRVLMEFLHGAGEGVPSDGVVDTARKTVTKVSFLAQEMVESIGDEERYAMLRERLRARGTDFLDTTYPRVAVLAAHARRARFIVHETGLMSQAADRMRIAIATILSETTPEAPILKHQLETIKEARDQLAIAADRAWAIVQSNPGCSLTRSINRILDEKKETLEDEGVSVEVHQGVLPERDAIALWPFEFRFILENLVTNAVRAMRSSAGRTLTIETCTDAETCSVRVTDTGDGMDDATAAALFDAKGDGRNGGFGMPNSRLRLRESGGDLVVESTERGKGTTFLLTVPHWTPNTGDAHA